MHVVSKILWEKQRNSENFYSFYIFKEMFSHGGLHQYFTCRFKNSENRFCKTKFSSRTCCSKIRYHEAQVLSVQMKTSGSWWSWYTGIHDSGKVKHLNCTLNDKRIMSQGTVAFPPLLIGLAVLANFSLQITNTVFILILFSHKCFAKVVEAAIFLKVK